jgi:hypothetical protein
MHHTRHGSVPIALLTDRTVACGEIIGCGAQLTFREIFEKFIMNDTDNGLRRNTNQYMRAAARLEQPLGALAESMDEVERIAAQISHSTYMAQVVADRAKWHEVETMTQPMPAFAATLAERDATQRLLKLLAPSLVFPAATPMQIDLSGEALHRARQIAELHKENLRKMISAEIRRIDAMGAVG